MLHPFFNFFFLRTKLDNLLTFGHKPHDSLWLHLKTNYSCRHHSCQKHSLEIYRTKSVCVIKFTHRSCFKCQVDVSLRVRTVHLFEQHLLGSSKLFNSVAVFIFACCVMSCCWTSTPSFLAAELSQRASCQNWMVKWTKLQHLPKRLRSKWKLGQREPY